ncbi:hypothetical protein KIN20_014440 [Parelaphostrongylus tenuis]|uniref:Uncharacterized protein n=1 Tax=Parelaphostrongylus tenuis TaxID=148309 RepID=A0AAD5MDP8_PARTN|nr:hypothetical protein KIN20_014440 [Parelaphostrongylus tenuis]
MKSTKLKGKIQQANLLVDVDFNASQCRDLDLGDNPRSVRPTKVNSEYSIAASEDDSKSKEGYFDQIQNLADRWQNVVENDSHCFEE